MLQTILLCHTYYAYFSFNYTHLSLNTMKKYIYSKFEISQLKNYVLKI